MKQPLRRRVRARILEGLSHVGEHLPRRAWHGALAGTARMFAGSRYGERAAANLRTAYGDELSDAEVRDLVRRVLAHTARQTAEWLRLARSGPPGSAAQQWIRGAVELDSSIEQLKALHAEGRGVIIVTPHLGNWELLAARLRLAGYDGAVVGRQRARDSSSDWIVSMRRAYDVETIAQDASPRESLAVLAAGGVLGLLPDLEVRRLAGAFLPFFGVPALTMTAPAALARAHRVPLLPARCILPEPAARSDTYTLSFEKPLAPRADLPRREATLELTTRLNALFERWIRETPTQWAWHQHRWRTKPGTFEPIPLRERRRRERGGEL